MGLTMDERPTVPTMDDRQQECTTRGHSWGVIQTLAGDPSAVVCTNCGEYVQIDRVEASENELLGRIMRRFLEDQYDLAAYMNVDGGGVTIDGGIDATDDEMAVVRKLYRANPVRNKGMDRIADEDEQ